MEGPYGSKRSYMKEFGLDEIQYQKVVRHMRNGPRSWDPELLAYVRGRLGSHRVQIFESQMALYKGSIRTNHQHSVAQFIAEWIKKPR
jgi:hypothetical protein